MEPSSGRPPTGSYLSPDGGPGYGKLVVIDHSSGYSTVYAHNSRILVKEGQRVRKGDPIAAVGSTGYATGPHLHYEIRKDGVPLDPTQFLR
jgi:murein DD-endopeptidase MepM/ murein hydrolase activator NlpD